ncbi:MAG TPA: ATP-dependent helicase HrpB [Steroidobacteraceae bacterium]|nr:ATP-dependent helicase HrpB [Steroidobacteraceae bacterium]
MRSGLPIDEALPELTRALASNHSVVLQAPPGAGKSTVVPLALLEQPWMTSKRLLMLEPRRLAARAVAHRMAQTLKQSVGATVGYRMRMDTRVSRDTRVEVVTEGVLTRMLQTDPALEGIAAVIFDEYHERSLQADLGLALALDARANLTPDLKILVMSATLDGEGVAKLLDDAPIVTAQGRVFPVESRFVGKGSPLLPPTSFVPGKMEFPEDVVARTIAHALREEPGDVLVFLPGAREIRRVQSLLQAAGLDSSVRMFPLFGELSGDDQEAALLPASQGTRKVVLATNIAETSLTIQGVRIIVDSGLVRRSLFDPATGMSRLETQRISRASAEQRQGRAGRVESGVCYRVWSEGAQRSLAPFTSPEIVEADLAPLALELASWGARDASELRWLDPPPAAMLASARDLLSRLGALDASGRITPHGRQMARLSVHPRLAHMLLRASDLGCLPLAADLAALLSERDLLRAAGGARDADIRSRLELVRGEGFAQGVDRVGLQRARRAAKELVQQVRAVAGGDARGVAAAPAGLLLAFAYPDRVGRRRPGTDGARYTLANGRGAHFADVQNLGKQEFIVAVDLDDRERDARILLAAPLTRGEIEEHLSERLERGDSVEWNSREQAVLARRVVRLDAITLEEKPLHDVPAEAARAAMLQGVRELGINVLPWTRDARDLQARMEFVRLLEEGGAASATEPAWPAVSDEVLAATVDTWLAPWLDGVTRRDHLARLSLPEILRALLPWDKQRRLDELAPTHLQVPSGSNIRIDYLDESAPAVSVKLQEVFGLDATPRIGGGRVPITFKLLSPAQRPVQVTRDLASFWRGSYADVRKDMRGRYPKHYWPENPLEAEATRGVRRRKPE